MPHVILVTHSHCPDGIMCSHLIQQWIHRQKTTERIHLQQLDFRAGEVNLEQVATCIDSCRQVNLLLFADVCPALTSAEFTNFLSAPRCSRVQRTVILDHHPASLLLAEEWNTTQDHVEWRIDLKKAACEIVWDYFFRKLPLPRSVQVVSDVDLNRRQWKSEALFTFLQHCRLVNTQGFQLLDQGDRSQICGFIKRGHKLLEKERQKWNRTRLYPLLHDAAGNQVGVVAYASSHEVTRLSNYLLDQDPKLQLIAVVNRCGNGKVCLRSRWNTKENSKCNLNLGHINVKEMAERLGGGGHDAAAGFWFYQASTTELRALFPGTMLGNVIQNKV